MKKYLDYTRSPWGSFLFVLPLLVLYQATALLANLGQRRAVINGADALVQNLMNGVGLHGWLGSWLILAGVAGVLIFRADRAHSKAPVPAPYLWLMLLECALYALVFGSLVAYLTALILPGYGYLQIGRGGIHFGQKLATSLGAGLYEELVFRLAMTGGLIRLLSACGVRRGAAATFAVLFSSAVFSLFHYLGPSGEVFQLTSFAFRFVAGLVLACLFWARGFAVAAWTHALYDVFLLLVGRV